MVEVSVHPLGICPVIVVVPGPSACNIPVVRSMVTTEVSADDHDTAPLSSNTPSSGSYPGVNW